MTQLPESLRRVFWNTDFDALDDDRDADHILARILEYGVLADVQWAMERYGLDRIHVFFKQVGHPELSGRTLAFWRALFRAEGEKWATGPAWRRDNSESWTS